MKQSKQIKLPKLCLTSNPWSFCISSIFSGLLQLHKFFFFWLLFASGDRMIRLFCFSFIFWMGLRSLFLFVIIFAFYCLRLFCCIFFNRYIFPIVKRDPSYTICFYAALFSACNFYLTWHWPKFIYFLFEVRCFCWLLFCLLFSFFISCCWRKKKN